MSNVVAMEKKTDEIKEAKPEPKPARFVIAAELEGFPVQIEIEGKADNLKALLERLKAIGAQPPQAKPLEQAKPAGAPLCPVHGKPMKASRKPGSFFCPHRM